MIQAESNDVPHLVDSDGRTREFPQLISKTLAEASFFLLPFSFLLEDDNLRHRFRSSRAEPE